MRTYLRQFFRDRKKMHGETATADGVSLANQLWTIVKRHRIAFGVVASLLVLAFVSVSVVYLRFAREVEARLGHGSLQTSSMLYAAPRLIGPKDELTREELIARLKKAGYSEDSQSGVGHFRSGGDYVEVVHGPESYFKPHHMRITFKDDQIAELRSITENKTVDQYFLEPELITNVLDESRARRSFIPFADFPEHVVQAVISVEDKRFFQHSGLDMLRVAKAAWVDIREGRKQQGASTLTMQLARSFWLDQDKNWKRKMSEAMLALELERRFSKPEIFQMYANEVYLGRRGTFAVHGFGEASRAYFSKDVRQLTVVEAATLAGMIQRPSYFNPLRSPERVQNRRDLVLTMMHNNGYLDAQQLTEAKNTPLEIKPGRIEPGEAPYFIDMVNFELQERFDKLDFENGAYRIYTTLDMDLQKAAVEAIQSALPGVSKRAGKRKDKGDPPQVALVTLDAKTGAIKALVGGRDYSESQLNRVFAKRQPGSTFKPFVYAAGMNRAVQGQKNGLTAGTRLIDEPTTFMFNNKPYQPANFGNQYTGSTTVRRAVMKSLNVPTVKAAEMIGYNPLVEVARAAGITAPLDATPSLALGSYEIPPIEMAEAYTIFSNRGVHASRFWATSIRDHANRPVYTHKPGGNRVLDERVAYIMTNIMEDVIRAGTAGAVRSRGFKAPAAGKTGTARDGWFAGFTSELLTVVWVGYDDYRDLSMEGSKSALPIWTEFMKKAHNLRQYSDPKPFKAPDAIVRASIDGDTGLLAGPSCSNVRTEMYVAGTQPKSRCGGHYEDPYDTVTAESASRSTEGERKGVVGRIVGVFR